jgi:hypothetical protein
MWNVLSLYRSGALKTLIDQLNIYRVDIVALQEIQLIGNGTLERRDCTLFYSCDNKDHIVGSSFLVSKRIKHLIIDFIPISHRICILRMRGKFCTYSIVNGHAPTETSDDEGKDGFF